MIQPLKILTLLFVMVQPAFVKICAQEKISLLDGSSSYFENKVVHTNKVITSASEQNALKVINGKVTSADMKPLEGASVRIKGTDKGVTTNAEGLFRIVGSEEATT